MRITLTDQLGPAPREYRGEVEIILRDRRGRIVEQRLEPNIVKIFAKECISHRLPYSNVWDPTGGTGSGAWVASGLDTNEEFAPKYFLFGASFDQHGLPLNTADSRFYTYDTVTSTYIPISLGVGADYDGGLINAIPISEPHRPLKKVERVYFEPSYQPAGTPYLQSNVRAMNNTVVFETVLLQDEYNGFGTSQSDYFTITEVALAAGFAVGNVGACECLPQNLLMQGLGVDTAGTPFAIGALATGTETVTIVNADITAAGIIGEGDQIKIVDSGDTAGRTDFVSQITPYYLVISKSIGGSDLVLDRTPTYSDGTVIPAGTHLGVLRSTCRIFSHRILSSPIKKSVDFSATCRWRIICN